MSIYNFEIKNINTIQNIMCRRRKDEIEFGE